MMTAPDPGDVHANELIAAGGVWMALHEAGVDAQPVVRGVVTTSIDVRFPFLKSTYRLTVAMVPGTAIAAPGDDNSGTMT